jgi:hypothetical protein
MGSGMRASTGKVTGAVEEHYSTPTTKSLTKENFTRDFLMVQASSSIRTGRSNPPNGSRELIKIYCDLILADPITLCNANFGLSKYASNLYVIRCFLNQLMDKWLCGYEGHHSIGI